MRWFALFYGLDGRIGRKTFWLANIALTVAELVIGLVVIMAAVLLSLPERSIDLAGDIVIYGFAYPEFAIAAKRGHDRNISAWVIGICGAFILARTVLVDFGWLTESPDQHVATTKGVASFLVTIVGGIIAAALVIELGFRRGTRGPNRFGPDPLAKAELTALHPAI